MIHNIQRNLQQAKIQMFNLSRVLDWPGERNPQFFREAKGRWKSRNIGLAIAFSLAAQLLLLQAFGSALPQTNQEGIFNRYCLGSPPPNWEGYKDPNAYIPDNYCLHDLLGNWMLNWQLWWLDVFLALSAVAIIILLVGGIYLLVADLSKEERRGTLNLLRLSPQTAKDILLGKLLGVPILLYFTVCLAIPLQLLAGLAAGIPLGLILVFYITLAAGCICFYRGSLLFGLVASGWGGLQNWLAAAAVWWLSTMATMLATQGFGASRTPLDWLTTFYPGIALSYAVDATYLPVKTAAAFSGDKLGSLLWYGVPLWSNVMTGIGFVLLNYLIWSYWLEQALKRRFRNVTGTLFSKRQSYQITACFIILISGFVFPKEIDSSQLMGNFGILQVFIALFTFGLIAALSPQRQALQDWAQYRHKIHSSRRNLVRDLVLAEKSPIPLAIAINLGLMAVYLLPLTLLLSPNGYRLPLLISLLLGANVLIICAAITQQIILLSLPKRGFFAAVAVGSLVLFPPIFLVIANMQPDKFPFPWLFTILPLVALEEASTRAIFLSLLGQWLVIALLNFQMTKQLKKVTASSYKLAGS